MPIYAYKCPKCGYEYDKLQTIANRHDSVCPKCGERSILQIKPFAYFSIEGMESSKPHSTKKSEDINFEDRPIAKLHKSDVENE